MHFFAYHGVYDEERKLGTDYILNISIDTNIKKAGESDDLEKTINYETVYEICRFEMKKPSNLLEHVVDRIEKRMKMQFPNMKSLTIKLQKLNPPMPGKIDSASIETKVSFEKKCKRCGKNMTCYGDQTCWCHHVILHTATLEHIKTQFGGCLCPKCLNIYADKRPTEV